MRRYIADQHFFDEDVLFRMDKRKFGSVDEMNEYMIAQWNDTVKRGDEVFVLGDMFSLKGADPEAVNRVLHRLKGKITLIIGNHDAGWIAKPAIDTGRFKAIHHYMEINDTGRRLILSHYPIPFFGKNHMRDKNGSLSTVMLHGHLHDTKEAGLMYRFEKEAAEESFVTAKGTEEPMTMNLINCFCGYSDYRPLGLDEWIARRDAGYRT
ncbi:MAG: metallophosphoesterase family protein [Eubacterium sp.]|nr:metallophosphoesterase family protein [Eubacterium sp.]